MYTNEFPPTELDGTLLTLPFLGDATLAVAMHMGDATECIEDDATVDVIPYLGDDLPHVPWFELSALHHMRMRRKLYPSVGCTRGIPA
jgi:hypothetical protein